MTSSKKNTMFVPLLTSAKTIHSFSFATHIIIYGSRSNWSRISFESSLIYLPTLCDISLACHLQNPMCCHSQRLAKEKYYVCKCKNQTLLQLRTLL